MPKDLKLAVFDCDGTLVDSQALIRAAMADAAQAEGLAIPTLEAVRAVIGLSLGDAVVELFPKLETPRQEKIIAHYKHSFMTRRQQPGSHEPLYQGVREVLAAFAAAGFLLAIATGKSRRGLDATLALHGLSDHFTSLQTADRHPGKPHPAMLIAALDECGVNPCQAVMIGDTRYDIDMAHAAGVAGIGVSWGYHPPDLLRAAGALSVADAAEDLPSLVDQALAYRAKEEP